MNGMPLGVSDDDFPWARQGSYLETKYPYVCHAELNAILNNPGMSLKKIAAFMFLYFLVMNVPKQLFNPGSKKVYYLSDKYEQEDSTIASKRMMDAAGVSYKQLKTNLEELKISYRVEDV